VPTGFEEDTDHDHDQDRELEPIGHEIDDEAGQDTEPVPMGADEDTPPAIPDELGAYQDDDADGT
jgi:hypothetical protein